MKIENRMFEGELEFLSNFSFSPVVFNGITFPSIEIAFQSAKAETRDDFELFFKFKSHYDSGKSKRLGRKIKLREDWELIKEDVMLNLVRQKFKNREFADMLVDIEGEITENTIWHDNYWGNCTCPKCKNIVGQNKLGKILMQVREEIVNERRKELSSTI